MIEFLLETWPGNVYSASLPTRWRSQVQSMFVAEYIFVIKTPIWLTCWAIRAIH